VDVIWPAVGVAVAIELAAIGFAARSFQAPDILDARYASRQGSVRALIEADWVLPELASMISQVNSRLRSTRTGADEEFQDGQDAERGD